MWAALPSPLKWIAEYANLHGILMAPHGTGDGIIGLAALVQVSATLPQNYIAFEYPIGRPEWWYDIVEGLPDPIVTKSYIDVWDRPGMGVTFNVRRPRSTYRRRMQTFLTEMSAGWKRQARKLAVHDAAFSIK